MKEQIVYKKVSELKLNTKNPRKNDDAVDTVAKSIQEFGFKNPLIIDKNGVVWCGNTRLKASKKLGLEEVPCIVADDLTEEQIRKLALIDNKSSEIAEWDFDLLKNELAELDLSEFELDWGVTEDVNEKEVEEDDFDVDNAIPEEPKAKLGDIYQLGEHRLMCGDSTKEEDVAKLMNRELADLVVTDPPYNVAIVGGSHALSPEERLLRGGKTIINDKMGNEEFGEFLTKCFNAMNINLKQGGVFYIWYASAEHINFESALLQNGLQTKEQLIWNKSSFTFGRADYHWKHEPCLYGWKEGASHYFTDDRTQSTVIEDKGIDLKKLKKDEMLKLLQDIYSDKVSTTIINEDKPSRCDLHPTMKPIKLLARLIKNSSRINENVLDLFGGSGSTLIASEQLGRKCYMMELDPRYVDVIIQRWEDFTGKKAVKLN